MALCVLDSIVSTLLPNSFVLIGLAAWGKRWYFVVVLCLLSWAIVLSKSRTSSENKNAALSNAAPKTNLKVNMDGGGGDSFDPCECICSHEGAMRRLISLVSSHDAFLS